MDRESSTHLDDNAVSAYVAGLLDPSEAAHITAHLDRCEACLGLICAVVGTVDAGSEPTVGEPFSRGATLGRYEVEEMIGKGGMGEVYAARDPKLGRRVALKVVRSARFAEPEVRARIAAEGRAMAQIAHPNVVAVYDTGDLPDGVFIAMELFDGGTLASIDGDWRKIVAAFAAAARGLAAAHARGIVHRDFKPANVLVSQAGRVAVSDFGLAFAGDAEGHLVGTPRYMSPEQRAGGVVDARSDQYNLAIALREAIAADIAAAPTISSDDRSATVEERRSRRHLGAPPVGVMRVPRLARARLRAVIARAIATDPGARFATTDQLADALDDVLHPRRWWLAAGVAGIAIAAAVIVAIAPWHDATAVAPDARIKVLVARPVNRTGDTVFDDTLDSITGEELVRSTRVDVSSGVDVDVAAAQFGGDPADLDDLVRRIHDRLGVATMVVRCTIARDGDGFALALDADDPRLADGAYHGSVAAVPRAGVAHAAIGLAAGLRRALGDRDTEAVVDSLSTSLEAIQAWQRGQRALFGQDVDHAIEQLRLAISRDPSFAQAHQALGIVLYNAQLPAESAAELERAATDSDRLPPRRRLNLLGDYDGARGKYSESIGWYEQVLASWPGESHASINATATALDAQSWPLALELARAAARTNHRLEPVQRNLVLAELAANELVDAVRDGDVLRHDFPQSSGLVAEVAANALVGNVAHATELAGQLANPGQIATARAELALYVDDPASAVRILRGFVAEHDDAGPQWVLLARALLRSGDRAGALAAVARDVNVETVRIQYLAARVELDAGADPATIEARAREWQGHAVAEWRVYGHVLAGDVALARGDAAAALREYREAAQHGPSWALHARTAVALAKLGDSPGAAREREWLAGHRGEIAAFLTPSLSLVAEANLGGR
jgi:tetratricopeptide (TPR) repeat protein/tRNA A-37 threonylcarbamoyl transferase component Bud32